MFSITVYHAYFTGEETEAQKGNSHVLGHIAKGHRTRKRTCSVSLQRPIHNPPPYTTSFGPFTNTGPG